jgi:hypothetical protein
MDVSRENQEPRAENNPSEGNELVRSLVALTGLPDGSLRSELSEILSLNQDASAPAPDLSAMSLEDLRSAMLVYLESIHADMMSQAETDGSGEMTEN